MAHDVFISYSSKDKTIADAATAVLEGCGVRCWVAPRDIVPGADWGEAIIDAIAGSRVMVLVFSANANASPQVKREVERAVNKGVTVVPFRIENVPLCKTLEYFVSTPHWMDAYAGPLEDHLSRLARTVLALVRVPGPGLNDAPVAPAPVRRPIVSANPAAPAGRRSAAPKVGAAVLAAAVVGVIGVRVWWSPTPRTSQADVSGAVRAARSSVRDETSVPLRPSGRSIKAPEAPSSQPSTPPAAPAPAPPTQPAPQTAGAPAAEAEPDAAAAAEAAAAADLAARRAAALAEARRLNLRSVTVIGKQRSCVIDAQRLVEGDTVNGFHIEQITAGGVIVAKGEIRFELRPRVEAESRSARGPRGGGGGGSGGPEEGGSGQRPSPPPRSAGPTVWGETRSEDAGPPPPPPPHGGGGGPRGPRPPRPRR